MKITATCSCCGKHGVHELTPVEEYALYGYRRFGRSMGKIQDVFPNVPAWIRSGAIDQTTSGFCICPECSKEE